MRLSRSSRVILAALAALLIASIAVPAYGASATWRGIAVILYDIGFGKTPTLVVSGVLTDEVTLPATVELPVPANCDVGWVGEILGGDQSKDIVAPFTIRKEDGYDVLVITVTKSRVVQAELAPPADWVVTTQPGASVSMAWTAHNDLPGVLMGFELDTTWHAENIVPASTAATSTATGVHYSYETTPVPAGTMLTLAASLAEGPDPVVTAVVEAAGDVELGTPGEPLEAPGARTHSTTPIVISILTLAVGALLVVLVFALRRPRTAAEDLAEEPTEG